MSERWVRHVKDETDIHKLSPFVNCRINNGPDMWHTVEGHQLPKSKYIECAPPEVWVECTREVCSIDSIDGETHLTMKTVIEGGYTARLINTPYHGTRWAWRGDALVIERKK